MSRLLAILGVALTLFLALVGQFDPDPQLSKAASTVSDFAVADRGGVTDTAMVTFGATAIVLIFALRPKRIPSFLLGLFGVAMFVAAIAPTDPGTELSTVGYIHRYASMTASVALPAVALMLSSARPVKVLSGLSFALMVAMAASSTVGDRVLIGFVERLLLGAEVVLMGVLAVQAASQKILATRDESAVDGRSYQHDNTH